jgi:hypothetical protein
MLDYVAPLAQGTTGKVCFPEAQGTTGGKSTTGKQGALLYSSCVLDHANPSICHISTIGASSTSSSCMHLLFPLNVFELIFDAEIVVQIQLLLPQCDKAPGTPRYPRDYNKNENVYVYDDSSNDNHNTDKHQQPRQPTTIDEAYDGDDKNNNRDINTDQQYNDNHAQQRRRRRRQFSSDSPKR